MGASNGTNLVPLLTDIYGNLQVVVAGGSISGGNPAAGAAGATPPADADYSGISVTGVLQGQTGSNPTTGVYAAHVDGSSVIQPISGTVTVSTWSAGILPTAPDPETQSIAVTTSGSGYLSGYVVGTIIPLSTVNAASGRRVRLQSVQINDAGGQACPFHIYFFKATPSGGTYTDKTALVWGSGDNANKVGSLNILSSFYLTDASQSTLSYGGLAMDMGVGATTLYALIIAEGSTPSPTATCKSCSISTSIKRRACQT